MKRRRGQAMLELALLIPLVVLLIGATVSFGLFFFQANVLQQAVDVGAQEISRMPFGPTQQLGLGRLDSCGEPELVCNDADFKARIFDEKHLVIPDSDWASHPGGFSGYVATLPLINRLLTSVMIRQCIDLSGATGSPSGADCFWVTRYPGTLVRNCEDELTVLIPLVEYRATGISAGGTRSAGETIVQWVAPVEEIRVDHDEDATTEAVGPYSLNVPDDFASADAEAAFQGGMVALRINYPTQATTLLNRIDIEDRVANPRGRRGQIIVLAGDTVLAPGATLGGYTIEDVQGRIAPSTGRSGSDPNAGRYGLGELEALQQIVRPYRKVISCQAIYRREVYAVDR